MRTALLALGTATALGLSRFGYGLFLPAMRDDLDWTLTEAGTLTAANGIGYLLGAALSSRMTRPAAAFRSGMALTAASLGASATLTSLPGQLIARTVAGLACAFVFIAGATLATRTATVTTYFSGTGYGIIATGATLPPLLTGHPGRWPLGWWLLTLAATAATLATWQAAAAPSAPAPAAAPRQQSRPGLAGAYFLFGAGYLAYLTFLTTHLSRTPTTLVAVTWVMIGAGTLLAGRLWKRPIAAWPGHRALTTLLTCVAAAAALPLLGTAAPLVTVSALAFGLTFMMVPAAVTTIVARTGGDPTRQLAALTVIFATGQTLGPWSAGWLADHTNPAAPLATAALCCGLAAAASATRWPRAAT